MGSKRNRGLIGPPPPAVYIRENARNNLPITEQEDRLNFYQENRNEPVPPPPTIISNVRHIPARPPPRGVQVPDNNPGKPVKQEESAPSGWWAAPPDTKTLQEKEILRHSWQTTGTSPVENGNTSEENVEPHQEEALSAQDTSDPGVVYKFAYNKKYRL